MARILCQRAYTCNAPHEAWAFGCEPDFLAKLVLRGQKTATTSSYPLYALENEPLPQVGEYNLSLIHI